jgi:hypothetical protein
MSSCSSCSSSGNYLAQLVKQVSTPPVTQNPATQQQPAQTNPVEDLKTSGNTGRNLNITA